MPNLIDFENWLSKAINYEKTPPKTKFSLDSMQNLTKKFNEPQNAYKSVHIAGSKGKGSVSAFIASILEESGFLTGLYTSPHVLDFSERVRKAHGFFSNSVYANAANQITSKITADSATWFELVTLFAFLCFKEAKVDFGVFETGLGGRLDATNVIMPQLCVLTPIELEHTQILGDSIEKIAIEKAGIIKPNVPVCVSSQSIQARTVFIQKAAEKNAPLFFIDDYLSHSQYDFTDFGMPIELEFKKVFSRTIKTTLKMIGRIQMQNAALAAFACKTLLPDISETLIENGLAKTQLLGRFEIIHTKIDSKPLTLILDGAHTAQSIRHTLETLQNVFGGQKTQLLFACAYDKNAAEMASIFLQSKTEFNHLTLTLPGSFKKGDLPALQNAFENALFNCDITINADYVEAAKNAIKNAAKENSILLVTGSFYLVGEVKKLLKINYEHF